MFGKKREKRKVKLIYSMSRMIILCWLIPLLLLTYLLLFLVTGKMNAQIENTIVTSADKAIEICQMQMEDVVLASQNASYIPTIRESYLKYQRSNSEQTLYTDVTTFLTQQYKYNRNILSTMLIFLDHSEKTYYTYGGSASSSYLGIRDFELNYKNKIIETARGQDTGIQLVCFDGRMFMIRNLVDSRFHSYGIIVMELNQNSIFESLNSVWGATGYQVRVDNSPLKAVGEIEDSIFDSFPAKLKKVNGNSVYIHGRNTASVFKNIKLNNNAISFAIRLDSQAILDELQITKIMIIFLLLFTIPLILTIFYFLYHKVNGPVQKIMLGAKEIKKGNYGLQITDTGNSFEFDSLEKSFNAMSMELKHQFEQIYVEELELKDAQIMALQSQINPHFLNNTLEIINWECRLNGNIKASSMIEALSVMLNATMNRKKQNMIPLSEELSYVDAYLLIIQQRFGSRLQVFKNIDHGILWVEVPRLIIQPIIENAVEHGMNPQNRGQIALDIYSENGCLHIDVTNNGMLSEEDCQKIDELLNPDSMEEDLRSTSLGIRNVNRRIKIIYGEKYGLTIRNNEDGNTVSSIILNMNYGKGEANEKD